VKSAISFVVVAVAAAVGTWAIGWMAVPIVALIAGFAGCRPGVVSLASASAWLSLLILDAASGHVGNVASTLAGVMGLPAAALFLVTLLLPALLGWSAASLGHLSVRTKRLSS
jgi:hypothetical protein